jgi:hypothetical protein
MNNEELWTEVWRLVNEYDDQRPVIVKEYRLYHNDDGSIIGLWETDHPEGENYVVLDDPDIFHRTNSQLLKVVDKNLTVLDPTPLHRVKLLKGSSGQRVVKGHAALLLLPEEEYSEIEHYDRTNT